MGQEEKEEYREGEKERENKGEGRVEEGEVMPGRKKGEKHRL